jgi:hypothetical protein
MSLTSRRRRERQLVGRGGDERGSRLAGSGWTAPGFLSGKLVGHHPPQEIGSFARATKSPFVSCSGGVSHHELSYGRQRTGSLDRG